MNATGDIVQRLRSETGIWDRDYVIALTAEAAAEITRLRFQVEDMKVSVAGFKQMVQEWEF